MSTNTGRLYSTIARTYPYEDNTMILAVYAALSTQTVLGRLLVGVKMGPPVVSIIDPETMRVIRTVGSGFLSRPWDVTVMPGSEDLAVVDYNLNQVLIFGSALGELKKVITLPLAPRFISSAGSNRIIVWYQSGNTFGVGYDLENDRADAVFTVGTENKVDGVIFASKSVYGVATSGHILRWNNKGGEPEYISPGWGDSGIASKPLYASDGWVYSLVRNGGEWGNSTLRRFRPEIEPTWDPNFKPAISGYRHCNYLAQVRNGELRGVAWDPSNGSGMATWNLLGAGSCSTRGNGSFAFDGMSSMTGHRGISIGTEADAPLMGAP